MNVKTNVRAGAGSAMDPNGTAPSDRGSTIDPNGG